MMNVRKVQFLHCLNNKSFYFHILPQRNMVSVIQRSGLAVQHEGDFKTLTELNAECNVKTNNTSCLLMSLQPQRFGSAITTSGA